MSVKNYSRRDFIGKTTAGLAEAARYTTKFEWNERESVALLNLGNVEDCARVKLNGKVLGSLLGPTYIIKVDNLIYGENLLEIEVTNVAANRIRDYDIRGWLGRNSIVNMDPLLTSIIGLLMHQDGISGKLVC